ncbi:MAG: terpene cyclase/mutase family protein [Ignavibacteria bacterium]|jgi:hypothetical protein
MQIPSKIIKWLLDSDPSIKWQVQKDLLNSHKLEYKKTREQISKKGWGAELLSYQDEDGKWNGGLYGRKWISTTYTMLQLRRLGLSPKNLQAKKACKILLEKGFYSDNGINYFKSLDHSETCVTGMILSLLSYFNYEDERLEKIAGFLISQQMKDGGWNCESFNGATHSSFHTTISVLEGLREFEKFNASFSSEIGKCYKKALEFLYQHKLYKSHRTNKIVDEKMTRFSFPPRWRYDVMRALDFLQEIDAEYDERISDAIELLIKKQNKDGTWNLQQKYSGLVWFDMEKPGKPSKWNTLRGWRILKWYHG